LTEGAAYVALSKIAWDDEPIDQSLGQVVALARRALPEAPEASMTLLDEDRARTAASSGDVAAELDQRQYDNGSGPCLDAASFSRAIEVAVGVDGPYPDYRESAERAGVTHSLSVGIPVSDRTPGAALNLYSSTGRSFTADSTRIAGTFAGFAGFALATVGHDDEAPVAERLQQALGRRALVSRAQDVLVAHLRCSREEAFAGLMALAGEQGVSLHDVARGVVDQAERGVQQPER
jgi:hypothetical protein